MEKVSGVAKVHFEKINKKFQRQITLNDQIASNIQWVMHLKNQGEFDLKDLDSLYQGTNRTDEAYGEMDLQDSRNILAQHQAKWQKDYTQTGYIFKNKSMAHQPAYRNYTKHKAGIYEYKIDDNRLLDQPKITDNTIEKDKLSPKGNGPEDEIKIDLKHLDSVFSKDNYIFKND